MTILLQLTDAHKRYGDQHLLDGANVALTDTEKVGLIGRNGAGKSTLCRVLLGEEELDAGEVWRHSRLRLGYLRQHDPFVPGETVLDFLLRDSGQPDWRCGEVAWRFEFTHAMLLRPIGEFSGGWQTRVKLAALLLHDPNLLILDEPTNFLDLRTQMLLEHFLKSFRAGCLIVSHDRTFLKDTCTQTLELARGQTTLYPGDVDAYLLNQRERREHDLRVNAAVEVKRRHLQTFIDKNRARASTASQARSKAKQLEKLQFVEVEGPESNVRIRVPDVDARKGSAVRCVGLSIGYPDRVVATDIELDVQHGSRIVVVGDNGQGKTTLLRTLTESLPALAGEIRWGYGCDVGVYAQHVYTSLPERWSVLEYLQDRATAGTRAQTILDLAGSFLFRGDDVQKSVKVLSGGERARLCLAGLLLGRHNVLVLDEPGNHLDVETVDALADAMCEYRGTIVLTSHDRHFIQRVATGVIEVGDGRAANYPGDYASYVYRVNKEIDDEDLEHGPAENGQIETAAPRGVPTKAGRLTAAPTKPAPSKPDASRAGSKSASKAGAPSAPSRHDDPKERNRRERELKKEIAALERKIARLDEQKRTLNEQLLTATDAAQAQRLHDELTGVTRELAGVEDRWFELQQDESAAVD